jgi:hypothetical protein
MSVGILGMLTLTGTTLIYYSSTTKRSAAYSNRNSNAYVLAEAGINEMMAVLSRPENNALNKYLLGVQPNGTVVKTTSAYDGGTVTWWGCWTRDRPPGRSARSERRRTRRGRAPLRSGGC